MQSAGSGDAEMESVIDAADIGVWRWNGSSDQWEWSPRARSLFGLTPDIPVTFDAFLQAIDVHDRSRVETAIQRALKERASFDVEFRVTPPGGSSCWLRAKGRAWCDAGDAVTRLEGVVLDIDMRKRSQEALVSSERQLRLALAAGRMGTWIWDAATQIVRWDESLEALYGLKPGTFGGTYEAFLERVHPDDRQDVIRKVSEAGASGSDYEIEFRTIRPDGEVRWISDRGQVLFGEDGARLGITGVCWDSTARKAAEQEIERSRGQVLGILESITDGFAAFDAEWRCTYVNRAGAEMVNSRSEDLLGRVLWEAFPEVGERSSGADIIGSLADGSSVEVERYYPPFDRWYAARIFPAAEGATIYYRDVTAKKRAEQRLAVQHAVGAVLAEPGSLADTGAPLIAAIATSLGWEQSGLWLVDDAAQVLRYSQRWHASHTDPAEFEETSSRTTMVRGIGMPGRVWASGNAVWIGDIDGEANFPRLIQASHAGFHSAIAFPILSGARVLGVIECFSRRISTPDPDLLAAVAALGQQIGQWHERRIAEQELRVSEARNRAILEAALDCIVTIDADSRIVEFNPAAEATFGFARSEVLGRTMAELIIPPQYRDAHYAGMKRYLTTGATRVLGSRVDVVGMRADGTEFPVELAVTRIEAEGPPLFTAYLRDITERQRHESEMLRARDSAEQASRAKSQFLANMSHELRTPLNAIIGYSEILQEDVADAGADKLRPDIQRIHTAGKHLLGLINDVLDLSKIEAGRMEVHPETFSIEAVLRDAVTTIQPLALRNRNTISVAGESGLGVMYSDMTKVRQCLLNLLSNAAKFTQDGAIAVSVERSGDSVRFIVADSGIGIAAEKITRLFEPFTQADSGISRRYGGTGLGLALTKRICDMLGGTVTAWSEPGQGSRFIMELPIAPPEPLRHSAESISTAALQEQDGDVVLVIDDDPIARELIQRGLERDGFRVVQAGSGQEGLELARRLRPFAITLDIMMPGTDGWMVLSELKADPVLCDIPVVVITIVEDRNLGYSLGASEFLTKPVDRERLSAILGRYRCGHGSCAVLVVEDDPEARHLTRILLERDDWKVLEARNGLAALRVLEEQQPDLILLDLMMPEMDGFEFVATVQKRAEWRRIPILVVTARDISEEDRRRLTGQVERVLSKGAYEPEELLAEVRRWVRKAAG